MRKHVIGEILPPEQGGGIVLPESIYIEDENTDSAALDDHESAIDNAIAELGTIGPDAKVNVYMLEPGKGSAFVGSFEPSNFSIEEIQRTFGPGEYKIHVRRDNKIVKNKIVRIAAPKIPLGQIAPQNLGIEKLAETMNAGFNGLAQMIAQTVQAIATNQPQPKTTEEILREMQLMKEILSPSNNQPSDSNTLDMFLRGVEFAKEIVPRDNDVSTNELILEGVKHFGGAFAAMKQMQSANGVPINQHANVQPAAVARQPINNAPHAPAVAPQSAIAQSAIAQPGIIAAKSPVAEIEKPSAEVPEPPLPTNSGDISSTESLEGNAMQANMESFINTSPESVDMMKQLAMQTLLANAKAGNDPETYANLALDMLGTDFCVEFVSAPDWFTHLCAFIPDAVYYRSWFEEMREIIFDLTDSKEVGLTDDLAPTINKESPTVADQGQPTLGASAIVPDNLTDAAPDAIQPEQQTENIPGNIEAKQSPD
jgi:hypothetical protein